MLRNAYPRSAPKLIKSNLNQRHRHCHLSTITSRTLGARPSNRNCLQNSHALWALDSARSTRSISSKVRHELDFVQVDAFTPTALAGNPAAVLFTQRGGDEDWMQAVAVENNLSETAFVEKREHGEVGDWDLRWFTPGGEVDLCGHATLGAAHALWETDRMASSSSINFHTRNSGNLQCSRTADGWIRMEFPVQPPTEVSGADIRRDLANALGLADDDILYLGKGPATTPDWILEVPPSIFATLQPDFGALARVKPMDRGVTVTCRGGFLGTGSKKPRVLEGGASHGEFDFSSRSFFPTLGVNEDPVCGSAHCILVPYWAPRLSKGRAANGEIPMLAFQASARGGVLRLQWSLDGRVSMEGEAVLVLKGCMFV